MAGNIRIPFRPGIDAVVVPDPETVSLQPRNNRPDPFRIFVRITYENIGLFYFAMNSTPSVPGPQWEEMTAPAVVSRISLKWPRLSRYFLTSSTISLSHPE